MPSPPSPATNLHFLLAYSPRRFLPAASATAVPFGDITLVLSAARNFLVEQSQMSGEAGTEHSEVDLHGQGEGRICSLCSLSLISAEIPDPDSQPRLYALVSRHMVHGPCGALNPDCPFMEDGLCTKHYPKDWREETAVNLNGYSGRCLGGVYQVCLLSSVLFA